MIWKELVMAFAVLGAQGPTDGADVQVDDLAILCESDRGQCKVAPGGAVLCSCENGVETRQSAPGVAPGQPIEPLGPSQLEDRCIQAMEQSCHGLPPDGVDDEDPRATEVYVIPPTTQGCSVVTGGVPQGARGLAMPAVAAILLLLASRRAANLQ